MALGLSQFTPGTAAWIAKVYPAQLGEAAPLDPAWAIRALVYYDHRLYNQVPSFQAGTERWAAALSAYNGGLGWVLRDVKSATGCNTTMWFGCVEDVVDARLPSNLKQNRDYPQRILKLYKPMYDAARW
jgi:soluble lytic murein transglycosylase-like protein